MKQANIIVSKTFENNPDLKPVTAMQKGRAAMDFIRMQEDPDNYMLHNRYLSKRPQLVEEYTSDEEDLIQIGNSPLKYRKTQIGSKKDLQRAGFLNKPKLSPRVQSPKTSPKELLAETSMQDLEVLEESSLRKLNQESK